MACILIREYYNEVLNTIMKKNKIRTTHAAKRRKRQFNTG